LGFLHQLLPPEKTEALPRRNPVETGRDMAYMLRSKCLGFLRYLLSSAASCWMVPDPAGIASRRSGGTAFVRNLPIHFLAMNTAPRARTAVRSADAKDEAEPTLPPAHDWRTTDDDERLRRKLRAQESPMRVRQAETAGICSAATRSAREAGVPTRSSCANWANGRSLRASASTFASTVWARANTSRPVLAWVQRCRKVAWREALRAGSPLVDLVPSADGTTLQVERNAERLPPTLARLFDDSGRLVGCSPEMLAGLLQRQPASRVRLALECGPWLEARSRAEERVALRREYEAKVQSGEWPAHETLVPLSPTSARACCTSRSPVARCWPTRWGWARPSRRLLPARCCTGLAGLVACWW
jgi:hypothetical protein